jgi:hypothetical protein
MFQTTNQFLSIAIIPKGAHRSAAAAAVTAARCCAIFDPAAPIFHQALQPEGHASAEQPVKHGETKGNWSEKPGFNMLCGVFACFPTV